MRGQLSGRLRAAQKSGSEQAGGTSSRCRLARAWHRMTRLSRAQAANAPNSVKECDVDAARLARGRGVRGYPRTPKPTDRPDGVWVWQQLCRKGTIDCDRSGCHRRTYCSNEWQLLMKDGSTVQRALLPPLRF